MRERWLDIPAEHDRIWRALGGVGPEPLSSAAFDRIQRTLDAVVLTIPELRGTMTVTRKVLAAAAGVALVIGGVTGFGIGSARSAAPGPGSQPAVSTTTAGDEYLLLVHETEATQQAVRERGMQAIVAEYAEWAGGLARQGKLVSAHKLTDTADWVGSETPLTSVLSGFFLIRAESHEEAVAIARQSPHARHGGLVEVRAIDSTGD